MQLGYYRFILQVGLALVLCWCWGCAAYNSNETLAGGASFAGEKLSDKEWRIVLFRWPMDQQVVSGGSNKTVAIFHPYIEGAKPLDDVHTDLPDIRDEDRKETK